MTTTLDKAFLSIRALPADVQDEVARQLLDYASKWQALKDGIDEATNELKRGEGVDVKDLDAFLDDLTESDGRT
ncbi:MAG: hypothetical protein MI920_10545 [Kiloniellales bacterium]|nr:hypothetical protein [Kiloniellales bacterium]